MRHLTNTAVPRRGAGKRHTQAEQTNKKHTTRDGLRNTTRLRPGAAVSRSSACRVCARRKGVKILQVSPGGKKRNRYLINEERNVELADFTRPCRGSNAVRRDRRCNEDAVEVVAMYKFQPRRALTFTRFEESHQSQNCSGITRPLLAHLGLHWTSRFFFTLPITSR